MGRLVRQGLIAAVVLSLTAGGLALRLSSQQPSPQASAPVDADVDQRRTALEHRIAEARQAGQLRGLIYFSLLDQQHRLLVHQRQAEANGMSAEEKRALLEEIDHINANVDKHIGQ